MKTRAVAGMHSKDSLLSSMGSESKVTLEFDVCFLRISTISDSKNATASLHIDVGCPLLYSCLARVRLTR